MAINIGSGISIGGGTYIGWTPPVPVLVLNLDAANYNAVPVNGTVIVGTGGFTITTLNPGSSMTWSATNGGIFRKTADTDTDFLEFGPDFSTTTSPYTVMMVYRSQSGALGRLLNAGTASPDWLLGLWGSSGGVQDVFFNNSFVGPTEAQDNAWQFIWATYNGNPGSPVSNSYIAAATSPTLNGTETTNGGFDGLRLFGRYSDATTSTEVPTADVGLVKVWDGALGAGDIQAQWNTYKTRFGY